MKPRLLLVEDDPTTCAFLHAATLALDVEIDQAASLHQAFAFAKTRTYDAVCVDARLPDGSGVELLMRLRQQQPGLLALAHTAATDPTELQRLREAGFDAAVSKPLPATHWQAAVRALLAMQLPTAPEVTAFPVWDDAAALKVIGGNRKNLDDLRGLFRHELPLQINALEHAQAAHNHAAIQAELHRLRASCSFVGAARLAAAISAWPDVPDSLQRIMQIARETLGKV